MTPALERALRRREALMRPRGDRGNVAGLASLFGGAPAAAEFGAGGPGDVGPALPADQGPGLPGATTGGITAPGKTHFFIRGRGPTIDFGPIFRPRSSGVNPMEGAPFRETTGVGGFFRRLLGDNANELNDQWQQARINRGMQIADREAEWDFRRGLAQEAQVAQGEENELRLRQEAEAEKARLDLARQTERDRNWAALQRQQENQIHDLTKMISEQRFQRALQADALAGRKEIEEIGASVPRFAPGGNLYSVGRDIFAIQGGYDENFNPLPPRVVPLSVGGGGAGAPMPAPVPAPASAPAPDLDAIRARLKALSSAATTPANVSTVPDAEIPAYGVPPRSVQPSAYQRLMAESKPTPTPSDAAILSAYIKELRRPTLQQFINNR